jgi:hypothetical protein
MKSHLKSYSSVQAHIRLSYPETIILMRRVLILIT